MFGTSPPRAPGVTEIGAVSAHFLEEVGMRDAIKGKAHEIKGKITGDKSEELKGKAEQAADKAKRTGRDIRDDVGQEADRAKHEGEMERDQVERNRQDESQGTSR
jgi:uncharacterized protein YjbJ (UPF0337 family)